MYPVLIKIGPLSIPSYGFMLGMGFLVAIFLSQRLALKEGIEKNLIADFGIWVVLAGIAGARCMYVLCNLSWYLEHPLQVVFSRRGFVFHGGFLSAAIAGFIFLRKRGISFWKIGDLVSPGLSLGYAIARIGCFLNGCCYGKCTNSPLGIKFPDDALCYITSSMAPVPIHPTQLYSFFSSIVIFVILLMLRKRARFQGEVFVNYILLYSTYRFTIEFLRADYPDLFLSLTLPQLISIAFFGLSLGYFLYKRRIGS